MEREPETGDQALKRQLSLAKETASSRDWDNISNAVIARNTLHEDLGRYSSGGHCYNLDQDTRDRLLVHARQDAAHALLNTISMMVEMQKLRRWRRAVSLGLLLLGAVAMISVCLIVHWSNQNGP
jgi:hypothetical protein